MNKRDRISADDLWGEIIIRVSGSSHSSGIRQSCYRSGFPSVSAGCEIDTRLGGTGLGRLGLGSWATAYAGSKATRLGIAR